MPNESTPDDPASGPEMTRDDGGRLLARRYRLGAQVGRGGMGTVWQAYDEVLGRDVAVKEVIFPYGLTDDERDTQYKRTFREARTAARLAHPGVVTVYDVVEEDGRPWIIMELIRARSLDQVIKKDGPLHWRRAADVGRQMLGALHAAHEAGVLHRDVKPSNVLLAAGDRAVLTDFGIATSVGDTTLTTTGLVMGSPAYIAPERARGRPIGPASDLWSLGVAIYAMVDGKSPFERVEPMASLVAIISDDPAWTASSGPLWPVIEGLLRKDPDQRMTAHEAGLVLDDIVRDDSVRNESMRNDSVEDQGTLRIPVSAQPEQSIPLDDPPLDDRLGSAHRPPARQQKLAAKRSQRPRSEELPVALAQQAPPTDAAPVMQPTAPVSAGSAGSVGSAGPPTRTRLVWAAAVLVAVLGLGWAVFALWPHDHKSTAKPPASPTSPSATPSPTVSAAVPPPGFKSYKRDGFATVVPTTNWNGPLDHRDTPGALFEGPNDSRLTLRALGNATNALEATKARKGDALQGKNGVNDDVIGPATGPGVPSGAQAADLVYTWTSNTGRKHVIDRTVVMNGHAYAITALLPEATWQKDLNYLGPVFTSFKATS